MRPYYQDELVTIYCGDCREVLPLIDRADMIFCDPPYPRRFVDVYGVIAQHAARMLPPGGFCYAYCGAHELPEILCLMGQHLTWFWSLNIRHNGGTPRMWSRHLMVTSKPVVVYTNGNPGNDIAWCAVDFDAERKDKLWHEWGQGVGFALQHIDMRTKPGDLIVDPCMGGAATLRACKLLGRRAVGIEIDKTRCADAVESLSQTVLPLGALFTKEGLQTAYNSPRDAIPADMFEGDL